MTQPDSRPDAPALEPESAHHPDLPRRFGRKFQLGIDQAAPADIDARIRDSVELTGTTPWILMSAILIASIGLNVNSTAVIIGAMLISPLMGPIIGIGYSMAVYDFALIKRSAFNLLVATGISLAVSALYFAISPLREAGSELLARSSPTLWDVLIAFFGGIAGVLGITRRETTNVIPGVAIATALMPPICTAGYGLATQQWHFFGNALYLYFINCVFIALPTLIALRLMHMPAHRFIDRRTEYRVKIVLWLVALATALPSAWLATQLVNVELYKSRARQFVAQQFSFPLSHVTDIRVTPASRTIEVALIGSPVPEATLAQIRDRLAATPLRGSTLKVYQTDRLQPDMGSLRSSLLQDIQRDTAGVVQGQEEALRQMTEKLQQTQSQLDRRNALTRQTDAMVRELRALYPSVSNVFLGEGLFLYPQGTSTPAYALEVRTEAPLREADRQRIIDWFKARLGQTEVHVHFTVGPVIAPPASPASAASASAAAASGIRP